jgi:NDP-sugar pyrophosphorylase family protein
MKAMILAAGLGTRLRPLTNHRPKALVELNGRTLLEITLRRLQTFGVCDVIINAHHFADMISEHLRANRNFGMRVQISREDELLDTGGGLKKAAWFFLQDAEPFVLHNVDVISSIDLQQMVKLHASQNALATLAVQKRETSRYLLFDKKLQLCGRQSGKEDRRLELAISPYDPTQLESFAFCGIHIISPRLLSKITEDGVFSIIQTYLRLAAEGERMVAFRADEYYWRDLGKPADLSQAARDLAAGLITISSPSAPLSEPASS